MTVEIPSYTLLSKLGEGAMADVWLAEHKRNGRKAAIKILKSSVAGDSDLEKLFLREGQVIASFDHINIVKIYDNDRVGEVAFLAMEYLAGGNLFDRMRGSPVTVGEALGLITQIASALEAAHQQNIIHRDLKPANVMLRDETTPVLTDFGAVRMLNRSTIYGRDGSIVGTPLYMSPEQVTGQTLGGSSDLYALGVIFFELLTGDLPFPGQSFPEIASQHLYAPIPQLPQALSMLQPVLNQLLAKIPGQRYASAQAFIDDLRGIYINDEALRLQVGYSGTSMAWSTQLRALGFVLDAAQKDEVRRAQGEYLRAQDASRGAVVDVVATTAITGQPPAPQPASGAQDGVTVATLATAAAGLPANSAVTWVAGAAQPNSSGSTQQAPIVEAAVSTSLPSVLPQRQAQQGLPWLWLILFALIGGAGLGAWKMGLIPGLSAGQGTASNADGDFVDNGDGTLADTNSGLVWTRADNGADINWTQAKVYCSNLDMRLPSGDELAELAGRFEGRTTPCGENDCQAPALFLLTDSGFWSGTKNGAAEAWGFDFSDGEAFSIPVEHTKHARALCVSDP